MKRYTTEELAGIAEQYKQCFKELQQTRRSKQ
jgi:hypothetical protein